jgi:hypothetical protein
MSTNSTAGAMSEAEERNQAKLTHIINGFFPLWGGLIFWLINKDRSKFMDDQGKEALNFGINIAIASFVAWTIAGILFILIIPLLLPLAVWGYSVWMGFQASAKAAKGELYRYPICPLRLVK